MKRRIWTVAVGLAALAALIAVPAAMAAYTSPKLEVHADRRPASIVKASLEPERRPDGARAGSSRRPARSSRRTRRRARCSAPSRRVVKALDLAGADLPLEGQLVVAAPGQIPAATQAAVHRGATPLATWVMVLTAAGQTLHVPTYLVPTTGASAALGPAFIAICLPPPDVPVGTPGRATFGAKVYSAELTINGVFSTVATGAWISLVGAVHAGSRARRTPPAPSSRRRRSHRAP